MTGKLQFSHLICLSLSMQYGVTAFSLPRLIATYIGTNGWAALAIFGAIASMNIVLIAFVYRYGKGADIATIARRALPAFIIHPLFFLIAIQWTLLGFTVSKDYLLILRSLSFPTLPPAYLYVLLGALIFMLLTKGIMSISNIAPIFLCLLLFLLVTVPNELAEGFDRSRLTTFWFEDAHHSLSGWMNIYFSFLGYESALLLMPYANKQSRLHLAFQIGNGLVTIFYTFVSFMALGFFSFEQLKQLSYPILNMLSNVKFPFAQRLDDFIFNLTLLRALLISTTYLWMAVETFRRMRPHARKQTGTYILLLVIAIAVFFLYPTDLNRTNEWLKQLGIIEIGVAFILPILLLALILVSKIKERRNYA